MTTQFTQHDKSVPARSATPSAAALASEVQPPVLRDDFANLRPPRLGSAELTTGGDATPGVFSKFLSGVSNIASAVKDAGLAVVDFGLRKLKQAAVGVGLFFGAFSPATPATVATVATAGVVAATTTACGGGGTKEVGQLPSPTPVTGPELLAQLEIKKLQVEVTGAVSPFSGAPDFLYVFNLAGVNAKQSPSLVKSLTTLASEVSGHQVAVTDVEGKVKFIVMDPVTQDVFEYIDPTHVRTDNEGWATSVFAYSTIQGAEPGAIAIHESDAKEIEALTGYQVVYFLVSEFRNTITATASTEATVDIWLDQDAYLPRSTKVLGDLNPNIAKSAALDNNGALKLVPNRDANDQLTDGGQNIVDNTTEDAPGQED